MKNKSYSDYQMILATALFLFFGIIHNGSARVQDISFIPIPIPAEKYNAYLDHNHDPAWFRKGTTTASMAEMPLGKQEFGGIPWQLAGSRDKPAVIMLKGAQSTHVAESSVSGIPVNQKLSGLLFLMTFNAAKSIGDFSVVCNFVIHYSDGSVDTTFFQGKEIQDWQNVDQAWKNGLQYRTNTGIHIYKTATSAAHSTKRVAWPPVTQSSKPSYFTYIVTFFFDRHLKDVSSIDIIQTDDGANGSPALFAVTGVRDQLIDIGKEVWGYRDLSYVHKDVALQYNESNGKLTMPTHDNVHFGQLAYNTQKYKGDFTYIAKIDSFNMNDVNLHISLIATDRLHRIVRSPVKASSVMTYYWYYKEGGVEEKIMGFSADDGYGKTPAVPYQPGLSYMKLERKGDVFSGYVSKDGTSWQSIGSKTKKMTSEVFLGIYLTCAHVPVIVRGTLSNISITGTPIGNPASMDNTAIARSARLTSHSAFQNQTSLQRFDLRGRLIASDGFVTSGSNKVSVYRESSGKLSMFFSGKNDQR